MPCEDDDVSVPSARGHRDQNESQPESQTIGVQIECSCREKAKRGDFDISPNRKRFIAVPALTRRST